MTAFLKKNWFFAGILVVVLMAFGIPSLGQWAREYSILNVGIFLAFFITGLTLETSSIGTELRRFKAPVAAMISSLVVIPLLFWLLAVLTLPPEFIIGVCIIATAPVTVAAGTVMTYLGRGNVSLSLFICVLGNFLAVFTIPFSLKLLLSFGGDIELPVLRMLSGLALTVLVPTILGQLVRPLVKDRLAPYRKSFSIFQQCVVLLIIFNAVASSADRILQAGTAVIVVLVFMIFLHSLVLAMNYALSRLIGLDRPSTTAFTIHLRTHHVPALFGRVFCDSVSTALIGHRLSLTQTIMDSIVANLSRG
jgi:sodium/bile acid cotransporter 7